MRAYPGPEAVVVCLRNKKYKKVHYTECGRTAVVRRLCLSQLEEAKMSFLRRAAATVSQGAGSLAFPDERFQKKFPALYEHLTQQTWPEGGVRQTSTLSLFADEGQLKGSLNNRDEGLVLFATGKTLEGLLVAMEASLMADEPPWRKSAFAKKGAEGGGKKRG
jgi:hypothetical protein